MQKGALAIRYRTKDNNGHISGGHILHGMGESGDHYFTGVLVACSFGTMTQVNSITGSLQASFKTAQSG